ncbi:sugar porter family MFS transporter [Ferruginibacter albus]|uniref:sugar porter family MFS transporter n=1 Tax=Ferruginibacter albus TaxID=2875540 RepID=UPI001CC4A2FE|nr:sugar porter family MFS transporter [Ferruginibacter albus]UAY51933.1 sugar porter family MFS transporter [Ferruginibacter albus]
MANNSLKYIYQCTVIAAVGGLLFGYDTAVVAGAIGFIEKKFLLSAAMKGWAASCALIGCMIGAMVAGVLSDKFGRKMVLIISAIAFAISSIGILIPGGIDSFIFFRFIGGAGIGIASILAPMYISEIAPPHIRGKLISIYQLGIVIGILLIYFVNAAIAGMYDEAWNIEHGWRWMFGSGVIPSIIFLLLLIKTPESPRWLASKNKWNDAKAILVKMNGEEGALKEMLDIKTSLEEKQGTFTELFQGNLRKPLIIGILLAIFSQVTGINAIMYYAPEIFKAGGSGSSSALLQTICVGGINFLMTLVAIKYVDKLGRKKLLLIGSAGMFVCLGLVAWAFHSHISGSYWILAGILAYISFFAISLGPLTFVVAAEIFPTHIRGRAMGLAIFFLWLSVYIVSQTFPILIESIKETKTFGIYMILSGITFAFVLKMVPETKGKTLEEIQEMWKK